MKVRAIMQGFYQGRLRNPGEEFDLVPIPAKNKEGKTFLIEPADQFSHVWMQIIDGSPMPLRKRNVGWDQAIDSGTIGSLGNKKLEECSKEELIQAIISIRALFNVAAQKAEDAAMVTPGITTEIPKDEIVEPTGDGEVI